MRLSVGWSTAPSAAEAAAEATEHARGGNGHARCAFAVVFSTDNYEPAEIARALAGPLAGLPWIGCTTAGVICGRRLLREGLAVGAVWSNTVRVGLGVGGPVSVNARAAGRMAVAQALSGMGLLHERRARSLVLLADATSRAAAEVLRGGVEEGGAGMTWAGGGVGDNLLLTHACELLRGHAYRDRAVALALEDDASPAIILHHGWLPYGPATLVTRASGPRLEELDFQRAFDVYRATAERHGDEVTADSFAEFAMLHPLGIPQAFGDHLIRDPISVTADGALDCVAEIPEGSLVRLMAGQRSDLLEAAHAAALRARRRASAPGAGGILFGCFSRYRLFGNNLEEELCTVGDTLQDEFPLIGCLTLGEVGAMRGGVPQFHNKTAVIMAF